MRIATRQPVDGHESRNGTGTRTRFTTPAKWHNGIGTATSTLATRNGSGARATGTSRVSPVLTAPTAISEGAGWQVHISNIGWAESVWGGMKDGVCDFATIRGVFPLAIKASEILGVDADLHPLWHDVLGNIHRIRPTKPRARSGRWTCRGTAALPTPLASGRRRSMRGVGRTGACMTRGSCKSASTIW